MILKTTVGNSAERRHLNAKCCGINYQRHLKSKVFHFLLTQIQDHYKDSETNGNIKRWMCDDITELLLSRSIVVASLHGLFFFYCRKWNFPPKKGDHRKHNCLSIIFSLFLFAVSNYKSNFSAMKINFDSIHLIALITTNYWKNTSN